MRAIEKRLRERVKELEEKLQKINNDRDIHRANQVSNLKTAVRIHGEGKFWNMSSLIETLAQQMHKTERWYW